MFFLFFPRLLCKHKRCGQQQVDRDSSIMAKQKCKGCVHKYVIAGRKESEVFTANYVCYCCNVGEQSCWPSSMCLLSISNFSFSNIPSIRIFEELFRAFLNLMKIFSNEKSKLWQTCLVYRQNVNRYFSIPLV